MNRSNSIDYDFLLSASVAGKLEETATSINNNIVRVLQSEVMSLSGSWQGETAELCFDKCVLLAEEISCIRDEIFSYAEQIKKVSRHIYLVEQEAKRIAESKREQE